MTDLNKAHLSDVTKYLDRCDDRRDRQLFIKTPAHGGHDLTKGYGPFSPEEYAGIVNLDEPATRDFTFREVDDFSAEDVLWYEDPSDRERRLMGVDDSVVASVTVNGRPLTEDVLTKRHYSVISESRPVADADPKKNRRRVVAG